MNKSRIAAIVVVVVLVAAAGILGLRSWVGIEEGEDLTSGTAAPTTSADADTDDDDGAAEDPEADPTPTPSPSESSDSDEDADERRDADERADGADRERSRDAGDAELASPSGIAADIQARLDRSGPKTSVTCPQAVPSAVGTSFTCSVAYADSPGRPVADARVNIVGSGLRYVWRSVPR